MKRRVLGLLVLVKESPPVRGRGLKHMAAIDAARYQTVAPRAGAWIETMIKPPQYIFPASRPPCGGVD